MISFEEQCYTPKSRAPLGKVKNPVYVPIQPFTLGEIENKLVKMCKSFLDTKHRMINYFYKFKYFVFIYSQLKEKQERAWWKLPKSKSKNFRLSPLTVTCDGKGVYYAFKDYDITLDTFNDQHLVYYEINLIVKTYMEATLERLSIDYYLVSQNKLDSSYFALLR